jgi:hypothetical protein
MSAQGRHDDEELLTVAVAAGIANRSVRTIRRAYLRGALIAHRDGNGRGVRIRYGDLRDWMMAGPAVTTADLTTPGTERPTGRASVRRRAKKSGGEGENLRLLNAARRVRANGANGRADAVALPAADPAHARRA